MLPALPLALALAPPLALPLDKLWVALAMRQTDSNVQGSTDRSVQTRTAALQRIVLFDQKPSVVSAPPAHLRIERRAESRCSRAPEHTAPCRKSLLART
jgi:hypothetical protein